MTGSAPESCAVCGHVWADVAPAAVADRLRAGVAGFADVLAGPGVERRPDPTRWSPLEYACHVRDVLLVVRERVLLAVLEDTPAPPAMYPDGRVDTGFYVGESPAVVADELRCAADLLVRTLDRLDGAGWARTLRYGYPVPAERNLAWVASQAVHEVEHHLADAGAV